MAVPLTNPVVPELVKQKLAAFEQLQPEFEVCFPFVQNVQGQQRFSSFPVANSVRYLHALWICECKDRLLSVYRNIERYEGRYCLELLLHWQQGEIASVVDFLQRKLDMLPLAQITYQIQQTMQQGGEEGLGRRLIYGRHNLLNRGMNLMQTLDAIFALSQDALIREVQAACEQYGHLPAQIEQQMAELETSLYSYVPHQTLAQRNMAVMNQMGVNVMNKPTDQPGERSWRVLEPTVPPGPFAQQIIKDYTEMTSPLHNNIKADRFVDYPEAGETQEVQRDVQMP